MIQLIFVVCINLPTFAYQQLSFNLINQAVSINNPFDKGSNRFINSLDFLSVLNFNNIMIIYMFVFSLLILVISYISFAICFKIRIKKYEMVDREFTLFQKISWVYLIFKLKFIRNQTYIRTMHRSVSRNSSTQDTSFVKYNENLINLEGQCNTPKKKDVKEDLLTLKTNEKILISAYFNKLRAIFHIEEENISMQDENLYCHYSSNRESKPKEDLLLKTILESSSNKDNDTNLMTIQDTAVDKSRYRQSSVSSYVSSEISSENDWDENQVITPITCISIGTMLKIVIKNSINIISIFYSDNKIMNNIHIIVFYFFKLYIAFFISSLISPCNISTIGNNDNMIYKHYLFSLNSIVIASICILISFPINFLMINLLKIQSCSDICKFELKEKKFKRNHIIAGIIISLVCLLGIINTLFISISNNTNMRCNTFYYDMIIIIFYEVIIKQFVSIIFRCFIYLNIFKDSSIDCCKKSCIWITYFFY